MKLSVKFPVLFIATFLGATAFNQASAFTRGIYITGSTAEDTPKLMGLIAQAKKYNIDTFVIDVNRTGAKRFAANVKKVEDAGIHFVGRVVIFPHGGTHAQVTDQRIWAKRLALAQYAKDLGASAIQLDYIRYQASNPPKPEKAKYISKVVKYFKNALVSNNVTLQMDIFGVAALKPAHTIGQDVSQFASDINAFCPMVYPSHYEPFREHAKKPYETIFHSVTALKNQLKDYPNVAVYAYIELYNYRYPLSPSEKAKYIAAEMKATHDAGANGWYVWSPTNHYAPLFSLLASRAAKE